MRIARMIEPTISPPRINALLSPSPCACLIPAAPPAGRGDWFLAALCVVCFAGSPADQALVPRLENAIAVETRTAIILRDMKNPPGAKPDRNNTALNRQLCVMLRTGHAAEP